jgi:hypothetical protein
VRLSLSRRNTAIVTNNDVLESDVFGKPGIFYRFVSFHVIVPLDLQYSISRKRESSEHNALSINPGLEFSVHI